MPVEITWLGRNCFRLKGRDGVVLTDPCPPDSGFNVGKQSANIVTISNRDDAGYSYRTGITSPHFLDAPGEYEVGGILVTGIATKRGDGGRNVVFVCEIDGIRVGHLGLASSQGLEEIKDVDILLFPAGGGNALGGAAAADVMTKLDPRVAIPMNFKTAGETSELQPLETFLKETGAKPEPQAKVQYSRTQLPQDLTMVVLEPRN
jgi:L-ascorbate metabolism protein UlaG (beta-lactamase superfamily)